MAGSSPAMTQHADFKDNVMPGLDPGIHGNVSQTLIRKHCWVFPHATSGRGAGSRE
jgi:hypothetical protein